MHLVVQSVIISSHEDISPLVRCHERDTHCRCWPNARHSMDRRKTCWTIGGGDSGADPHRLRCAQITDEACCRRRRRRRRGAVPGLPPTFVVGGWCAAEKKHDGRGRPPTVTLPDTFRHRNRRTTRRWGLPPPPIAPAGKLSPPFRVSATTASVVGPELIHGHGMLLLIPVTTRPGRPSDGSNYIDDGAFVLTDCADRQRNPRKCFRHFLWRGPLVG
jgi:hypothetical protein